MRMIKHSYIVVLGLLLSLVTGYVTADDVVVQVREQPLQASSGLVIGKKLVVVDSYTLPKDQALADNMLLVANRVDLQGEVLGRVHIIATQVKVAGRVLGQVSIVADHIEVQPSAVIKGKLSYLASSIKLADRAHISGQLQPWEVSTRWHDMSQHFPWFLYSILFLLGAICLSFRQFSHRMAYKLKQRPWMSLVCGMALVFLAPWLILTAVLSIVGIPLSLLLIGGYILSLSLAYIYIAWIIGSSLLGLVFKREQGVLMRLLSLALGLGLLYYIGLLPFFGKLVKILALCIGLGGMALAMLSSRNALVTTTEKNI